MTNLLLRASLWVLSGLLAFTAYADEPAPTLESVINTYRADAVLETDGSIETSPLFMTQAERRLAFAHFDKLYPTATVAASGVGKPLPAMATDLTAITFLANEASHTLGDWLQNEQLMGLMVVTDGAVLMEHYAPDHSSDSRWVTFSVTKSVTSLLIGAAIHDGYIDSVDDPIVKYLPRLAGSEYGRSRVSDILQMASGIAWNEDYEDPESDVALAAALNGVALTNCLAALPRVGAAGDRFNYNTAESNLVGEVLRSAIGMNAAPALLTNTSSLPKVLTARATISRQTAGSAQSPTIVVVFSASKPSSASSSTKPSSLVWSRPVMVTLAPSRSTCREM